MQTVEVNIKRIVRLGRWQTSDKEEILYLRKSRRKRIADRQYVKSYLYIGSPDWQREESMRV